MTKGPTATETRHFRTLFSLGAAGMLTDGQLLERFAARDGDPAELAFAALVERHGSMVLRVARGVLLDEHSAHDAFQATFLILARKARSLWVRDSLGPWLHAVAFRVASHARSLEIRRKLREQDASKPEARNDRDSDRADLIRAIHEEIDRLPEPFRQAVVTCHLEGLTQQDAAARLGWPVGTLQSRLDRGRRKLKGQLERRGLAPSLAILLGHSQAIPPALITSTARAAAGLNLGKAITGMIAPTALTLLKTTTKGMFMTKLKIGVAAVLVLASGVFGTGLAGGIGQDQKAQATEDPPQARPTSVESIAQSKKAPKPEPEPLDGLPQPAEGLGFPVLLDFHASWAIPSQRMRPVITQLVAAGYPVKTVDIDRFSDLQQKYKVTAVPAFILVDGSGHVLARTQGEMSAENLAKFYNQNRPRIPNPDPPVDPDPSVVVLPPPQAPNLEPPPAPAPIVSPPDAIEDREPVLSLPTNPKPWETVVRIKIHLTYKEWGFGSGTVISSTDEESIILTSGHIFRVKGMNLPKRPKDFNVPISVDLFNGEFVGGWTPGGSPAKVGRGEQDLVGEAIDYDFDNDVGLIRVRPGKRLPASRVVPADWAPRKGMKMMTVGCSHGEDATAWDTTILDPRVTMSNSATKKTFFEIKCAHQPKEGRAGGGLYTQDGYVAGVCDFADPQEHVGLYAVPEAIHALLDRNGLKDCYQDSKLVAPDLKNYGEIVAHVDDSPTGRLSVPQPAGTLDGVIRNGVKSDDQRRIDNLEKKLDQVLKALEDLKGKANPE